MEYRIEHDTMGDIAVEADKLWGAQTQRSFENFRIGTEKMPEEIIKAFAYLKKGCALANLDCGRLSEKKAEAICRAADEIIAGSLDGNFPLAVWQTGSGTQSNMNVNEVIANRGNAAAGEKLLHPNDDVNASQSSNDTFPSAMHIAAVCSIEKKLLPALDLLTAALKKLENDNPDVIKIGRTHLQDATPIKFSQEVSGWRAMLSESRAMICASLDNLRKLAIGGTAVGTGLNAPKGFDEAVCDKLTDILGTRFIPDPNKFHALTSKDQMVFAHGALKALAADLMKIANDVRWLASGPRCGIGELIIPANEPGSSIMPGKVNPTQCEAVTMVAV
ncbi:MAG: class II fumarate hydratase, partial [bacterium]|nr:class II fumarate hydratase [bacterium]